MSLLVASGTSSISDKGDAEARRILGISGASQFGANVDLAG